MRTVDDVLAEVMAVHAGKISTHSDRCYQYHAGCLAFLVRDLLDAEWEGITVRGLPAQACCDGRLGDDCRCDCHLPARSSADTNQGGTNG